MRHTNENNKSQNIMYYLTELQLKIDKGWAIQLNTIIVLNAKW